MFQALASRSMRSHSTHIINPNSSSLQKTHLRQNKWIVHGNRCLWGISSIVTARSNIKPTFITSPGFLILDFFLAGGGGGKVRDKVPLRRMQMLSVSYGKFVQYLTGNETNSSLTVIMAKTTYENHDDSNVSKLGRGGGTQSLADRKRTSQLW
jgi:hypothetical protein